MIEFCGIGDGYGDGSSCAGGEENGLSLGLSNSLLSVL